MWFRGLFFQSNINSIWGKCLTNTISSSILQQRIPYRILYESKLDYQLLKICAYLIYTINLPLFKI